MGKRKYHFRINLRMKLIYISIIFLFLCVFLIMRYTFKNSRDILINQEAGIIAQYMDRNEMALENLTDSMRKLSAASSTNRQVSSDLGRAGECGIYSSENAERIRSVENTLIFYRNIFFDYQLHYIIAGVDGSVYSIADGIDNNHSFGSVFALEAKDQSWYQNFYDSEDISKWIAPCYYTNKGEFNAEGTPYLMFIRKIRDYNNQRFLGISYVSFPVQRLTDILVPNEGSCLALFNNDNVPIYQNGNLNAPEVVQAISDHTLDQQLNKQNGYFHYKEEQNEYMIHYVNIKGSGWRLINIVPLAVTTQSVDRLYHTMSIMMVVVAGAAFLLCLAMYVYVNTPLNRLIKRVSQVNIGGTQVVKKEDREVLNKKNFGIMEAEHEIAGMVDYIEKLSAETLKQRELQQNLKYEMLRAQLNPHFLFNTLNVIKWSAMISGAGNIADMITSLGVLLENTMNRKEEEGSLREEVKVVRSWVEIKNWALKNRIQLFEEIPEDLMEFKVIKFCLQPLVENAVLHGMEHTEHGEIHIRAERFYTKQGIQTKNVCIIIQDNGSGIEQQRLNEVMEELDSGKKRKHVTGIGLSSIHELMQIRYGADYGINIESCPGCGTKIYLIFPGEGDEHEKNNDC